MTDQVNEAVAWMLRKSDTGFVRSIYPAAPTDESRKIAEIDGDEYVPLYAHPSRGVVDDEMVERAAIAIHDCGRNRTSRGRWESYFPDYQDRVRDQARAALQAAAPPASNNADTLSQALHGLHTVLYSGDWHMPDDTHAQLEGIYEDAKNGLGTGFIDAAQPVVPSVPEDGDTFAAISAEMREVVNGYDFNRDTDLSEWANRIDALAATLARQLAEAKAAAERHERNDILQMQRAIKAESQLAEATRRLGEVEGLVGKWRGIAHEYRYNPAAMPRTAHHYEACADELEAALTKEPTK